MKSKKQESLSFFQRHKKKIIIVVIILVLLTIANNQEEPNFEIEVYTSSCLDTCAEACRDKDFRDGTGECLSCGYWKTRMENKLCDCECWG